MAAKTTAAKKTHSLGPMVDELGGIEKELLPWKGKIARAEALRKALRGAVKTMPPSKELTFEGEKYVCLLGAAGMQTCINKLMLFKRLGQKLFVDLAGFTLKAIEENCSADVVAAVTSQEQSGTRSLKLMEKGIA
jgi:hypothetical protein